MDATGPESAVGGAVEFETRGYTVLKSVIDDATASFLSDYAVAYVNGGHAKTDQQVPTALSAYGSPMMEKLLIKLLPVLEVASGRKLLPTYSYFRVYRIGDALNKHKDRPACEISMSVSLRFQGAEPWPLFIEGPAGVSAVELGVGDALLYKGTECPHWREPFQGELAVQVFLHYVDQNGPYTNWHLDRRPTQG
jgi:hypothetical protein